MFTSSIKHEFRYFHFVVVQKQGKKCTKKCDARAKLLFCLLNPLSFLRSRCLPRHWILKSLLSPTTNCPCECDSKSKSVNKLPNTRVFIAAEKWMLEVLELVAFFLFKTGTCDVILYFVKICSKREGQIQSQFDE